MKKIFCIIAVLAAFSVSVGASASDSPWNKIPEKSDESGEAYYLTTEKGVYCRVDLRNDGNLDIYAMDPNWYGEILTEHARVFSKNAVIESSITVEMRDHTSDMIVYTIVGLDEGSGEAIFYVHCGELAKKLPAEIVKKFNGTFGVK